MLLISQSFRFLVLLLFVLSCASAKSKLHSELKSEIDKIHFLENTTLTEAIELAKKEDKPIFIDIYTDWCLPCKVMEEEVYSDMAIARYFNDNFINLKANGDEDIGNKLAFLFQAKGYPSLIFVDHRGRLILKHTGGTSNMKFLQLGEKSLAIFKERKSL